MHYRLALFANETVHIINGEELTALRIMALQDRTVLNMLLAKEGGVCHMVGDCCCTFIPANDGPQGYITLALDYMRKAARQLRQDEH